MKKPDTQMTEHVFERRLENARWLLSLGEHPDRVARRLGMSASGLRKMIERSR